MAQQQSSSVTYRVALGPQQGRKVFTLETLPAFGEPFDNDVGKLAGCQDTNAAGALRARLARWQKNGYGEFTPRPEPMRHALKLRLP